MTEQEQAAPVDWQAIAHQRERELKTVGEARHHAEQELERLRAGEEDGWDPLTQSTPGQWIARWNRASPEERLHVAERIMADAETASRCFLMAHEKRLHDDRHAWVALARVRDVIADMENITGARHWARILRKAVDGEEPAPEPDTAAAIEQARNAAALHRQGLISTSELYAVIETLPAPDTAATPATEPTTKEN